MAAAGDQDWGFRELNPHFKYTRFDYQDGGLLNAELHVDNHWDWENGQFITVGLNGTWDGLREPFEVYPGIVVPVGEHGGVRTTIRYNSDRRQPIYGRLQWDLGTFLNGPQSSPDVQGAPPRRRPVHGGLRLELSGDRSRCRRGRSTPTWATCG